MKSESCADVDLFGDVIVTVDDVEKWLDAVPHLARYQVREREYYAKNWDVSNKIKLSKLEGLFDLLIAEHEPDNRITLPQALQRLTDSNYPSVNGDLNKEQ